MNMSSMYRVSRSGAIDWVVKKLQRIIDIKAIVGENIAPMAVPLTCWKTKLSRVK